MLFENLFSSPKKQLQKAIFEKWHQQLYSFVSMHIIDPEMAISITVNTLKYAVELKPGNTVDEQNRLEQTLFQNAKTLILDHYRKLLTEKTAPNLVFKDIIGKTNIKLPLLKKAFNRLPDESRALLEMKTIDGMSAEDISAHLSLSLTDVETKIEDAYNKLNHLITELEAPVTK